MKSSLPYSLRSAANDGRGTDEAQRHFGDHSTTEPEHVHKVGDTVNKRVQMRPREHLPPFFSLITDRGQASKSVRVVMHFVKGSTEGW